MPLTTKPIALGVVWCKMFLTWYVLDGGYLQQIRRLRCRHTAMKNSACYDSAIELVTIWHYKLASSKRDGY